MPQTQRKPKAPEAGDLRRLYEEVRQLRAEVERLEAKLNGPGSPEAIASTLSAARQAVH
jgi:cell division septum initiation protein DivIVA